VLRENLAAIAGVQRIMMTALEIAGELFERDGLHPNQGYRRVLLQ